MDDLIEHCLYESGLTADGCWDELQLRNRIEELELFIGIVTRTPQIPDWLQDSAKNILLNKWEPKGGPWIISTDHRVVEGCSTPGNRTAGHEYPTKAQAEKARDAMDIHNRLLAYVSEFDAGWEANWNNTSQMKYVVSQDITRPIRNQWAYSLANTLQYTGAVYMSKKCAKELVDKLNSGAVVL